MVYNSKLSIVENGKQQNGIILGKGCAFFLCDVMIKLSNMYKSTCEELDIVPDDFNITVYETILPELLNEVAYEDVHHGRLIELMDELYKFTAH